MSVESSPARFITLPVAIYTGMNREYPERLKEAIVPIEQETPRYNPDPDILLDEFVRQLSTRSGVSLGEPPRKADSLAFNANFSDMHGSPLTIETRINQMGANDLAKEIITNAQHQGPLTVQEQLSSAMDIFDNNLADAGIHLGVVTRHMARGQDKRLFQRIVTPQDIATWQQSVAGFAYSDTSLDDPAGDTYHFWEAYIMGLSRGAHSVHTYGKLTGYVNDVLADNVARATDILRYKLRGRTGYSHGTIDILGYHLGRATWEIFN